jgi:hypothetical protein
MSLDVLSIRIWTSGLLRIIQVLSSGISARVADAAIDHFFSKLAEAELRLLHDLLVAKKGIGWLGLSGGDPGQLREVKDTPR